MVLDDRDRAVLDDIARWTRTEDPGFCDRLTAAPADGDRFVAESLGRLAGTPAVVASLLGCGVALLLGLPGIAVALLVIAATGLSVRIARIPVHHPVAGSRDDPLPPPYGAPPPGLW